MQSAKISSRLHLYQMPLFQIDYCLNPLTMKYRLLLFFFLSGVVVTLGQAKDPSENVVITSKKKKIRVSINEHGELYVNVSPKDVLKFKAIGWVRYSDFGARGDGKTDDINAIAATHASAPTFGESQ